MEKDSSLLRRRNPEGKKGKGQGGTRKETPPGRATRSANRKNTRMGRVFPLPEDPCEKKRGSKKKKGIRKTAARCPSAKGGKILYVFYQSILRPEGGSEN